MKYEMIDLPRIAVIGKSGLCTKEKNVVQDLWQQANSNFNEVASLGMKNPDGSFVGFWGAMSDETMSFKPWTNDFSTGLYLAGVEVYEDAETPEGWTKWIMPARKYLVVEVDPEHYGEIFGSVIDSLLPELGMKLSGAVCDFTEPTTGQNKLFFPVKQIGQKENRISTADKLPMVVIITGASHTGKTNLAQRLLEKYHYPYVSQDHIKMGLIRSGNTTLTPEDDDKLTDYLWPITREMIKTAIENHQHLIVEGCYIPFNWKEDFTEEYLGEIEYICLALSKDYIEQNFNVIKEKAFCIEQRLDDDYYTPEDLVKENKRYIDGCNCNNLHCDVVTDDYEAVIMNIVQ